MKTLQIGDKVVNPDSKHWSAAKKESPNYIGEIKDIYYFMIEGRKSWFAKVEMRDYEQGFSLDILEKI